VCSCAYKNGKEENVCVKKKEAQVISEHSCESMFDRASFLLPLVFSSVCLNSVCFGTPVIVY